MCREVRHGPRLASIIGQQRLAVSYLRDVHLARRRGVSSPTVRQQQHDVLLNLRKYKLLEGNERDVLEQERQSSTEFGGVLHLQQFAWHDHR